MNGKIAKPVLVVFLFTIIAKILGFSRDIILPAKIGVGFQSDTFYAVLNIIESIIVFTGIQGLFSVTTSMYSEYRAKKRNENIFYTGLLSLLVLYSLIPISICFFAPKFIISLVLGGFTEKAQLFASSILKILSANILFSAGFRCFNSILGVRGKFVLQNVSLPFINSIVVAVILISNSANVVVNSSKAIVLAYLTVFLLQIAYFQLSGIRIVKFKNIKKILNFWKEIGIKVYPLTIVTAFTAVAGIVDKIIASHLGEGVITSISISFNLSFFTIALFFHPIMRVIFPKFSHLYHSNNISELQNLYDKSIEIVIFIFLPLAIFFVYNSSSIVKGVYFKDQLPAEDILRISNCVFYYGIALTFNALYMVTSFLLQSTGNNKSVGVCGIIGFGSNVVFSLLFSYLFGYIGIPLGTAVSNVIFLISLQLAVKKMFSFHMQFFQIKNFIGVLLCSMISGILIKLLINDNLFNQFAYKNIIALLIRGLYFIIYAVFVFILYKFILRKRFPILKN